MKFLFSCWKYFTRLLCSLVKYFSTLAEKFRISAWACNILYLLFGMCKFQNSEQISEQQFKANWVFCSNHLNFISKMWNVRLFRKGCCIFLREDCKWLGVPVSHHYSERVFFVWCDGLLDAALDGVRNVQWSQKRTMIRNLYYFTACIGCFENRCSLCYYQWWSNDNGLSQRVWCSVYCTL